MNKIFKEVFIIHDFIHRIIGRAARHANLVMPRAESTAMDNSCQALCRNLVTQNGLQPENVDISKSVLYTSIMGLLLVTDNEVKQCYAIDILSETCHISVFDTWHILYIYAYSVNSYLLETTGLA